MSASKAAPISVIIKVNQDEVPNEIDTGAASSVMSAETYQQLWKGNGPRVHPSKVKLRTYTGEQLKVLRYIQVQAEYEGQKEPVSILVVAGNGPTLLGRDILAKFKFNWPAIFSIYCPLHLQDVLEEHKAIFGEDVGNAREFQAR